MSIAGPFLAGSGFRRNQQANTPFTFNPITAIPANAFIAALGGAAAADTDTVALSDSVGNSYSQEVSTLDPTGGILVNNWFVFEPALALATSGTVSVSCSIRTDVGASVYFFTGDILKDKNGNIVPSMTSVTVEWRNVANPSASVLARAGDMVFASIAVQGPNNDVFTQDANGWSADIVSGAANINATLHATGKIASADGNVTYAPTLGSLRRSVISMFAFR